MIESSAPTKSVNAVSMWSRPDKTSMMSELGFVYFFDRTATRKMLNVCLLSARSRHPSRIPALRQTESMALPPDQIPCPSPKRKSLEISGNGVVKRGVLTSKACISAAPWLVFNAPTALANNCLV